MAGNPPTCRSSSHNAMLLLAIVWVAAGAARAQPTTAAGDAKSRPQHSQGHPGAAAVEFATWLNTTIAQRQAAAGGALGTPECRGMLPALRACAAAAASTTANSSSCCVNTTSSTSQGCCPQQCSLAASKMLVGGEGASGCVRTILAAVCNATASANGTAGLRQQALSAADLLHRCLSGSNATCEQLNQPGSVLQPQMAAARALQNGSTMAPLVLVPVRPPPPVPVPASTLYSAAAPDPFQLLPSGATAGQVVLASPDEIAREARRAQMRPRRLLAPAPSSLASS